MKTVEIAQRYLDYFQKQGHTIVLITHNEAVAAMAQRTVFVRDGKLYDTQEEAERA